MFQLPHLDGRHPTGKDKALVAEGGVFLCDLVKVARAFVRELMTSNCVKRVLL